MLQRSAAWAVVVWLSAYATVCQAQDLPDSQNLNELWNRLSEKVPAMKTMGGRQFWGDVQFFQGWKIQQNVISQHYRLLDPSDQRHASGTLAECRQKLAEIREDRKLPPMQGRAVILIHGIIRSSKSFEKMRLACLKEGWITIPFDYPSTRKTIPENAQFLGQVIKSLEGVEEIDLVVHSMGGLVVRSWLDQQEEVDPRVRRMVMLGVPNRGADMADRFRSNLLFKVVYGPAGQQLVTELNGDFISSLPTPTFPFGVIAGGRDTLKGFNPLIRGDDDGTVSVSSTRLPGAADFVLLPVLHSFMMNDPQSISHTLRFLKTGKFRESGESQPIPEVEAAAAP